MKIAKENTPVPGQRGKIRSKWVRNVNVAAISSERWWGISPGILLSVRSLILAGRFKDDKDFVLISPILSQSLDELIFANGNNIYLMLHALHSFIDHTKLARSSLLIHLLLWAAGMQTVHFSVLISRSSTFLLGTKNKLRQEPLSRTIITPAPPLSLAFQTFTKL